MAKCPTCLIDFAYNDRGKKTYCSQQCLLTRVLNNCVNCNCEFRRPKTVRFCSRSCSLGFRNKNTNIKEMLQKKHGDAWEIHYENFKQKVSVATKGKNNGMYGRHDHVHGLQKYAKEKTGLTLEEIHGAGLASDMKKRISDSLLGSKNPMYGKINQNGGKSVKGHYKGFFFRSLLEYSFMKHLESRGLSLTNDVDYECFVIPYTLDGRDRTYRVDFYVPKEQKAYEVKPQYALKTISPINREKWAAAEKFFLEKGIEFSVITELNFQKVSFEDARTDVDVVWKEETFKYFKGHK